MQTPFVKKKEFFCSFMIVPEKCRFVNGFVKGTLEESKGI